MKRGDIVQRKTMRGSGYFYIVLKRIDDVCLIIDEDPPFPSVGDKDIIHVSDIEINDDCIARKKEVMKTFKGYKPPKGKRTPLVDLGKYLSNIEMPDEARIKMYLSNFGLNKD